MIQLFFYKIIATRMDVFTQILQNIYTNTKLLVFLHLTPNVFGLEISVTEDELFDLPTTGLRGPILMNQVRLLEHC